MADDTWKVIAAVLLTVLVLQSCESAPLAAAPLDDSDGVVQTPADEDTPNPPNDVTCDWEVIDEYHGMFNPFSSTEYKANLPIGSYMWEWSYTQNVDVTLTTNAASWAYYPNTMSGMRQFSQEVAKEQGILTRNNFPNWIDADIYLYQWICSDDPLNFNPDLFNTPYSYQETQNIVNP